MIRPLVSSVNGRPNLDNFVAVDIIAIDPAPTTGLTRNPMLGDLHPLQLVFNKSSTISIS